jgi:hypothetical protein
MKLHSTSFTSFVIICPVTFYQANLIINFIKCLSTPSKLKILFPNLKQTLFGQKKLFFQNSKFNLYKGFQMQTLAVQPKLIRFVTNIIKK